MNAEETKHVIGAHENIWTIYTNTEDLVEIMTFPRLLAIAEATWIPLEEKGRENFIKRMNYHYTRFDYYGNNYYREKQL